MSIAPALALAAVLLVTWLIADPRTPDLAGQVYRAQLFRQLGFAVWDEHWYAGHHLPGYSLLFGPLASLLGVRVLGAVSAFASVTIFAALARAGFGRTARWGTILFALAAVGDVWIGRVAFALGVAFALAAALAFQRRRHLAAVLLALLCAAASPVAGLLLALGALTFALSARAAAVALAAAAAVGVVIVPLALLFGEGGFEPYPLRSFIATVVVMVAFLCALPREQRTLRMAAVIYLLACALCLAVHTPMGSNVERYGVLLAGPLLLSARPRLNAPAVAAVAIAALWIVWGPVRETLAVSGILATHAHGPVRIEVPLTRSHWEAALLAPSVSLARGWEKQLDERYDGVLLRSSLSAAAYERWLREQAVAYVALPDVELDPSSAAEGRLIRAGVPFLRELFTGRHWRIFEVTAPVALASGPGELTALGHDRFTMRARAPGRFILRLRFTRYWTITGGSGCVGAAPGGSTYLTARAAGMITVEARFSLARALETGESCRARTAR